MSTTQIDDGISRYYSNRGISYFNEDGVGKFKEWCEVNGYGTDDVTEELQGDPSECCLIEFDENFPINKKGKKGKKAAKTDRVSEIFSVIKEAADDPDFGRKKYFVSFVIKIFIKFGFDQKHIIKAINDIYNKEYDLYYVPDQEKIIIYTQDDIDKIIKYLYNHYFSETKNKQIPSSDTDPRLSPNFPTSNVVTLRTYKLATIIAAYYRLNNAIQCNNYRKITDQIISFISYEDANKYIEGIYPPKPNKKGFKMKIQDSNDHFFEQLDIKNMLPVGSWADKSMSKDCNILGKGAVLRLNVLKNVKIGATDTAIEGSIFNKRDVMLNIDGNLEIEEGARLKSKEGKIILNVAGDIHLKRAAKIVTGNDGNIYIKCNNLKLDNMSYIETYDFGAKGYNKINHIVSNYALKKDNQSTLYGNVYIDVRNNLIMNKKGCSIRSGDICIKCGGCVNIKELKSMLAFRNNLNVNCNELKVSVKLIKNMDSRNKTLIKCNRLNIKNDVRE